MKCYKIVFKRKNIIINYGFYLLDFILLLYFICVFLFCFKFYQLYLEKIDIIISSNKNCDNIKIAYMDTIGKNIYKESKEKIIEIDPISGKKKLIIKIQRKMKIKKRKRIENKPENDIENKRENILLGWLIKNYLIIQKIKMK